MAKRLPDRLAESENQSSALPKVNKRDGELLAVTELQVTGKRCAESREIITFERDARLCPNCGEVFVKAHTPEECVSCGKTLGAAAVTL